MEVFRITDHNEFIQVLKLKNEVFGFKDEINMEEDYWFLQFISGKLLCYVFKDDYGKPIAGIFVSDDRNSLYVEKIFVKEKYRDIGLQLGRHLLRYVIDNKKVIEEYFNTKLDYSIIAPIDEKTENIYYKFGYHGMNLLGEMKRRI